MGKERIPASIAVLMVVLFSSAEATETSFVDNAQAGRFAIMENPQGQAVLDRTTQLIWERAPHHTEVTWATATTRCVLKTVGGQTGWRLPSFLELMTLVEPPLQHTSTTPTLPARHPFQGITAGAYWTNDSVDVEPAQAYTVDFLRADLAPQRKDQTHPLWCVRSGLTDRPQPLSTAPRQGII